MKTSVKALIAPMTVSVGDQQLLATRVDSNSDVRVVYLAERGTLVSNGHIIVPKGVVFQILPDTLLPENA